MTLFPEWAKIQKKILSLYKSEVLTRDRYLSDEMARIEKKLDVKVKAKIAELTISDGAAVAVTIREELQVMGSRLFKFETELARLKIREDEMNDKWNWMAAHLSKPVLSLNTPSEGTAK